MSFYTTPKFFKIIQNLELQNGEIRVPKKFVEKYWKGIPNPVEITLPNGAEQELFWVKHDGDIWFKKNWDKISKFLKFGYLVVFKYIGEASFKLKIYGIDCLEIDYSKIKFRAKEIVSDDNESVEAEFVTKSKKTKFGKRKMEVEFDSSSDDEFETDIIGTSQRGKKASKRGKMNKKTTKSSKSKINYHGKSINRGRMNKKDEKCSTRKTNNHGIGISKGGNPSFELKLTHTYATGYLFRIPCDFSRKYMNDFEGIAIVRRIGEDKTWVVEVKYDPEGDYTYVNSGWKQFADHYNLQIGDVCKFKMTRFEPLYFTVRIIRARK